MRRVLVSLMSCCLLVQPALASQERILSPHKVSLTADAGEPFGEVTAEVETVRKGNQLRFGSVKLMVGGKWEKLPEKAFADLEFYMLQKVELRTERGWDDAPWLYVYAEIAVKTGERKWITRKIHFAYHKGRFEHRSLTTPTGKGQDKWEKLEL